MGFIRCIDALPAGTLVVVSGSRAPSPPGSRCLGCRYALDKRPVETAEHKRSLQLDVGLRAILYARRPPFKSTRGFCTPSSRYLVDEARVFSTDRISVAYFHSYEARPFHFIFTPPEATNTGPVRAAGNGAFSCRSGLYLQCSRRPNCREIRRVNLRSENAPENLTNVQRQCGGGS